MSFRFRSAGFSLRYANGSIFTGETSRILPGVLCMSSPSTSDMSSHSFKHRLVDDVCFPLTWGEAASLRTVSMTSPEFGRPSFSQSARPSSTHRKDISKLALIMCKIKKYDRIGGCGYVTKHMSCVPDGVGETGDNEPFPIRLPPFHLAGEPATVGLLSVAVEYISPIISSPPTCPNRH